MAEYQHLEVERFASGVVLARLSRLEVLNAVNTKLGSELLHFFRSINLKESPAACVVLTGAGDRSFCVGGDLKERNGMTTEAWQAQRIIFKQYNHEMEHCRVPVICAVNGFALGGGAELVLRSDFAYAADHATFGFPEVKRGFMPGSGGTQRFARVAGEPRAMEWLLTGRQFGAEDALAWGMINKVVAKDELLGSVLEVAEQIAQNAPEVIQTIKQCVHTGLQTDIETALVIEALSQQKLVSGSNRLEGIAAFVEKRAPNWQK
jgi:enoyl-CoA hydratase/carnithine racemase